MNFFTTTSDPYDGLAKALIAAYPRPSLVEQREKREAVEVPAASLVSAGTAARVQFLSVAA